MERRYLNARVPRNEDARLLTGRARFVDDVHLPGMLHVAFVRSDHAHGRLREVDAVAARRRPGVIAVYTADDLGAYETTRDAVSLGVFAATDAIASYRWDLDEVRRRLLELSDATRAEVALVRSWSDTLAPAGGPAA